MFNVIDSDLVQKDVTYQMTVSEFGERMGLEYSEASGVVKFLVMNKLAKCCGKRKTATGKGKSSTVYEFCNDVRMKLIPALSPPKEAVMAA